MRSNIILFSQTHETTANHEDQRQFLSAFSLFNICKIKPFLDQNKQNS